MPRDHLFVQHGNVRCRATEGGDAQTEHHDGDFMQGSRVLLRVYPPQTRGPAVLRSP
jgi:hypothetical protein